MTAKNISELDQATSAADTDDLVIRPTDGPAKRITKGDFLNQSIETADIKSGQITGPLLASNAVSRAKIAPGVINDAKVDPTLLATIKGAVQPADFQPTTSTFWAYYNSSFGNWADATGGQVSFFTGAPSASTLIQFPDTAAKDVTGVTNVFIRKKQFSTADPVDGTQDRTVAQPLNTEPLVFHPYDSNTPTATFTLIADATTGGTGDHAYWHCVGTMLQSANFNPSGANFMGVNSTAPTQLRISEESLQVTAALLARLVNLGGPWEDATEGAMARFLVRSVPSPQLPGLLLALRNKLMDGSNSASDPLADTAQLVMLTTDDLARITIAHLRKHITPGTNEFTGYTLGGGASVGQATLTGSGNQLTLTPNSTDETDLQLDIIPNTLIALERVSNPNQFHLGLVNTAVFQGGLNPKTFTINFVAGEFRTVGGYDFSAAGNAGEAVKVVAFGDKVRQADGRQSVRVLSLASHIKWISEYGIREAIDAGDALAHHDIGLVAELVDSFYEGWTSVSGAHYTTPSDIRDNLPVDAANNDPAVRPTANTPVILREGTAWGGPPNIVWGLNVYGGTNIEYALGISTGGTDQYVYRRDGSDWSLLWEDGTYHNAAAASDPIFMDHWFDVVDGDIRMADSLETRRHPWSIPGISASNMALYRRDGRDVAAMIPNYGGANQIDYSWKRFGVDAVDIGADTTNFGNHLSGSDNTVQAALDTLDDLTLTPANNSITTAMVQDDAITADKIADSTITADKMASGVIPEFATFALVGTSTDVTETYGDLASDLNDNDFLLITTECYYSSESNNIELNMTMIRFGNLSTSDRWIPIRAASGGARFMIKRVTTGQKIQTRRAGAVSSTNTVRCYKVGTATS